MAKLFHFVVLSLIAAALVAAGANAAKAPSPTLSVSFPTLSASSATSGGEIAYGTPYVVSGCGYGSRGVTVVVHSPEAISFAGQLPDASGCISLSNFSTQGAGHYEIDAFQQLHGSKPSKVASMGFDL
jgi:hypothetical protein